MRDILKYIVLNTDLNIDERFPFVHRKDVKVTYYWSLSEVESVINQLSSKLENKNNEYIPVDHLYRALGMREYESGWVFGWRKNGRIPVQLTLCNRDDLLVFQIIENAKPIRKGDWMFV